MAQKKNLTSFEICAKIITSCSIQVSAASFEEALQMSKSLQVSDFITHCGDNLDDEFGIQGISAYPHALNPRTNEVIR